MSIELLLKDFDRLEALAKKADESLHIGKTAIQKDYAVAKMLDENIGAATDIFLLCLFNQCNEIIYPHIMGN